MVEGTTLAQELAFLVKTTQEDEATILAKALREGIRFLYREKLIEAFLAGKVPREEALRHLGLKELTDIEYQRDALRRDVEWGLRDG